MLRKEIYLRELHVQHKQIMQSAARGYLTIEQNNNTFYSPANCLLGFASELATYIINRQEKSQLDYTYLIVALQLTNQAYHQYLSEFKLAYPQVDHLQTINKLVEYFTNNSPSRQLGQNKESIRRKFEKLIGKAEVQGYFRISQVPAFLVSTNWLQKLYSADQEHPGPIRNQILLQNSEFPLSNEKYWHLNYKIRADVRQNQDFKIVPYEAWKLLHDTYGGVEIRRYTTRQKVPSVQIWYSNITFWIIEQRCILGKIELLVSKNQSLKQTMQRLRLTLQKYKVVPTSYIKREQIIYKVKGLQSDQFQAFLHSEAHNQILVQKMEKIGGFNIDFEELNLYSNRQALIVNFNVGASPIFGKVTLMKTLQLKQRCLKCGTNEDIEACKCKTVYFCSKKCRDASASHFRECDSIQSQGRKYKLVTEYYDVKRRCFPKIVDTVSFGKVGFENLGNTCYMNAAVQCVMRLEPLMRYFLSNQHLKDLNASNVLGSQGYLACSFGELVKSYYTTKQRSIEAAAVLRIIARNAQFRGYNHQDSQEFLNYFLDKLHEDLNRVKVKPYTQQVQSNGRPDEVVSQMSWNNYLKRNFSLVTDLLAGQYRSEIRCPDCQKISITFDPFLSLTLQFPRPQKGITLQGFFMTDEGQFQKVSVQIKPAMNTFEFYEKYFNTPVKAVQQIDKKIAYEWNPNLSLFQNKKDKGSIFFYEKPLGHAVQIQIQLITDQKTPNFIRIAFVQALNNEEQLLEQIYKVIRKPVQKALGKDLGSEGYLAMCKERSFVKILNFKKEPNQQLAYPITGIATLKVTALIDLVKLKASAVKLNIQSGTYDGKVQTFVRKVSNILSIQQLLSCFSEPQKLTQENAWYCNICKDHKLADKAMQLHRLPQYLIVHLKRFNHSGNRFVIYGEKVNTAIDLQQFEIIKGKRYELIGMVNHIGSLMHGHYTAMVKRDGWFNYDDSRCSKTKMDGRNAYLLFYQLAQ